MLKITVRLRLTAIFGMVRAISGFRRVFSEGEFQDRKKFNLSALIGGNHAVFI